MKFQIDDTRPLKQNIYLKEFKTLNEFMAFLQEENGCYEVEYNRHDYYEITIIEKKL